MNCRRNLVSAYIAFKKYLRILCCQKGSVIKKGKSTVGINCHINIAQFVIFISSSPVFTIIRMSFAQNFHVWLNIHNKSDRFVQFMSCYGRSGGNMSSNSGFASICTTYHTKNTEIFSVKFIKIISKRKVNQMRSPDLDFRLKIDFLI